MTRIILPILGGLLALVSHVEAKSKKDSIHLYQFTSNNCLDAPSGGNVDLERDQCVQIDARSLSMKVNSKRKKWLDDVNAGKHQCALTIYRDSKCTDEKDGKIVRNLKIPEEMEKCHTEKELPVHWVMFRCHPNGFDDRTTTLTTTTTATSWSVGKDDLPTPFKTTATLNTTMEVPAPSIVPHHLETRDEHELHEQKYVWMQHPWSGSLLCYDCYTKEKGKFDWITCRSGAHVFVQCGARPVDTLGNPNTTVTVPGSTALTSTLVDGTLTVTDIATATSTVTVITTTTVVTLSYTTTLGVPVEARDSWHKRVTFANPWDGKRMCADAEWEKRGQDDAEVRLQEVKYEGNGVHCGDELSIDGGALISDHTTTTRTGYTNIVTVTSTKTVAGSYSPIATTTWVAHKAAVDEDVDGVQHSDL